MGKRIAGTCYVKCDGAQFDITGGMEAPLMDVKREVVMGTSGPAGYKETAMEPYIKVTVAFRDDLPIDTLKDNTDMTVTAEFANGKVYTLSGAYLRGEPAVNGEEGTVELDFGGMKGIWS